MGGMKGTESGRSAKRGASRRNGDLAGAVQARLAPLLPVVLAASIVVALVTSAIAWVYRHQRHVSWWTYEASVALPLVGMGLYRAGRRKEAGILLSGGFFGLAAAAVLLLGGPTSPGCFLLVPVALTGALFWSWRAGGALAVLSVLLVGLSAALKMDGRLPAAPSNTPLGLAVVVSGTLVMTTVLVGVALRSLRDAVADANRHARELLALFQESPDAVVVLDDTGIVLDINPAMLEVSGLGEPEIVGRHFASLGVLRGPDAAVAIRRFAGILRGARRAFALRLIRADGSVFWGDARSRVFAGEDGAARVQVTIRDVTQRKLAEQRHAELQGQLLKLQRFETIGRLSGAVAHDVNNLLTIVAMVASALRDRLAPDARELADELCDSAARAAKLNRRLLLLGRSEGTQREWINVNGVIEGMHRLLRRLVGSPRELAVRLDAGDCLVQVDAAQLEQIIINLVTNARDAIASEGRVSVETRRSKDSVIVRVSDNGIGMDDETRSRIFEPFFTTKGRAGTGLGLPAVRDIVTSYGGRIEVESQAALGTRVEVTFPGKGAEVTAERPPEGAEPSVR